MIFTYKFIVTTYPGGQGGYDHGNWTGHDNKEQAIECAERVKGSVYKVKHKKKRVVLKKIK